MEDVRPCRSGIRALPSARSTEVKAKVFAGRAVKSPSASADLPDWSGLRDGEVRFFFGGQTGSTTTASGAQLRYTVSPGACPRVTIFSAFCAATDNGSA